MEKEREIETIKKKKVKKKKKKQEKQKKERPLIEREKLLLIELFSEEIVQLANESQESLYTR